MRRGEAGRGERAKMRAKMLCRFTNTKGPAERQKCVANAKIYYNCQMYGRQILYCCRQPVSPGRAGLCASWRNWLQNRHKPPTAIASFLSHSLPLSFSVFLSCALFMSLSCPAVPHCFSIDTHTETHGRTRDCFALFEIYVYTARYPLAWSGCFA